MFSICPERSPDDLAYFSFACPFLQMFRPRIQRPDPSLDMSASNLVYAMDIISNTKISWASSWDYLALPVTQRDLRLTTRFT